MKGKKILAAGLSALMSVAMLAGCSSSTPASSGKSGGEVREVTLTVWAPSEDQSQENGNWLDKELKAFEAEHPELKITWKTGVCSEGDALTNIQTDPEAAADVFMFANDQIPGLITAGALARLGGSTLEQVQKQNSQTTVNTVSYNGGVYGVPFTGNTWFMYYDKRVFTEDDAKSIEKMLEKGKVGFPLSNSWYIASWYVANGCTLFGENGDNADAGYDFGGDKGAAVTNYLVDLVANPNFVDSNGLTPSTLADGTLNCLFSGTWDYQSVVDAIGEENVGICAAPTYTLNGETKQLKAFAGSKAIGVNPNCKEMEVAVALAAFLGNTQAQQDHYDLRNIIPTDLSIKVDDALANAQMAAMDYASIVQPLQEKMGNYWGNAENMGKELVAKTVTHDNAAEKTEQMNKQMNSSTVE